MDEDLTLSMYEVECDGSACGSGPVGWHVHPFQYIGPRLVFEPLGRVRVENGVITHL